MTEKELRVKAKKIVIFKSHLLTYTLSNLMFFRIDYLDNGHLNWAYFVLLGWGVGIISHFIKLKTWGIFSIEKEMERLRKSSR